MATINSGHAEGGPERDPAFERVVQAAVEAIGACGGSTQPPRVGIVLGTGLGGYADQIETDYEASFEKIPGFGAATALGHRGQLIGGRVGGVPVIAMDGRLHRYEGHAMRRLAFPIHVMHRLGVEMLVLSNASGGVDPRLQQGDVLIIEDHINLMWGNPLIGHNDERLGPRFPDMSAPYDRDLIRRADEVARRHGFRAEIGVYAAMTGPNYETRAEYRFLRKIGADVVGMSTVPEVLTAVHLGLPVLALSAVTNVCRPDSLTPTDGQAVIAAARSTEPKMRDMVSGVIAQLAPSCG